MTAPLITLPITSLPTTIARVEILDADGRCAQCELQADIRKGQGSTHVVVFTLSTNRVYRGRRVTVAATSVWDRPVACDSKEQS